MTKLDVDSHEKLSALLAFVSWIRRLFIDSYQKDSAAKMSIDVVVMKWSELALNDSVSSVNDWFELTTDLTRCLIDHTLQPHSKGETE